MSPSLLTDNRNRRCSRSRVPEHPAATTAAVRKQDSEERANQITHAVGLLLSIVGTPFLLSVAVSRGTLVELAGCSVYCATLIALYAASTLSHSFHEPRLRHFFRTVDQVCIFLLIAGNYTPFALTYFHEGWLLMFSMALWTLALTGIYFKIFVRRVERVSTSAYVMLGWMPIIILKPLADRVTAAGLAWVVAGGLAYTIGVIFFTNDRKVPYFHAVWHVCVVLGSTCHYFAVIYCVLPSA